MTSLKGQTGRDHGSCSATAPAIVILAASAVFAAVARRVSSARNEPLDQHVRDWTRGHQSAVLDVAVRPVTLLSIPILVVSMTTALALWLRREKRPAAARAVMLTPVVAAVAAEVLTRWLALRNPPHAGDSPHGEVKDPSFPSGHTIGVTAEGLSIAYILLHEDLGPPAAVAALIAWPVVVGATRVYRDRHWLSDVVGGWIAGAGVAAAGVLLYRRGTTRPRRH